MPDSIPYKFAREWQKILAKASFESEPTNMATDQTRIDPIVGGIYRISTWLEPYGITFNQFLIDDERPTLIHTGMHGFYDGIRAAITRVLDPALLTNII